MREATNHEVSTCQSVTVLWGLSAQRCLSKAEYRLRCGLRNALNFLVAASVHLKAGSGGAWSPCSWRATLLGVWQGTDGLSLQSYSASVSPEVGPCCMKTHYSLAVVFPVKKRETGGGRSKCKVVKGKLHEQWRLFLPWPHSRFRC